MYRYHFMRYGEYKHRDYADIDEIVRDAAADIAYGLALALSVEEEVGGKWVEIWDEDELNGRAWEIIHARPGM